MSQTYYIDGYNVIHQIPELAALLHDNFEHARDSLIDRIVRWSASSGEKAKIIFDGKGKRTETSPNHLGSASVEIVFSSKHKTADMIIERAVFQAPAKQSVIVVSADRGITDLCMGKGALVMHPNYFWTSVRDAESETSRSISRSQSTKIGSLEENLNESELNLLRKIRNKLDKS